jgi:anhydro-N-acetylmuramic acid kinase
LQERLHACARGAATSWELAQAHHDLGRFYAARALRFPRRLKPELVGLHGQTVFHHPSRRAPATLQLGEPAYLAETLRAPVVSNFRAADLAAGGEGAPLATMFHVHVLGRRHRHVCVQNLGGIGNVTSIDWTRGAHPRVTAFDTGPANVLLDLAARHFSGGRRIMDRNGEWAARGIPGEFLLARWLKHPFFARKPPKSTGRELFGEVFLTRVLAEAEKPGLSRFDVLATLTELTARSIALNYRLHLRTAPDEVVLCGGGAANPMLVAAIQRAVHERFPRVRVVTCDQLGWPPQSIEPAAFALLAHLRMEGQAGHLPGTTGARRAVLLGQVSLP